MRLAIFFTETPASRDLDAVSGVREKSFCIYGLHIQEAQERSAKLPGWDGKTVRDGLKEAAVSCRVSASSAHLSFKRKNHSSKYLLETAATLVAKDAAIAKRKHIRAKLLRTARTGS